MKKRRFFIFLFIFVSAFLFKYSDIKAGIFDDEIKNKLDDVKDEVLGKCYLDSVCSRQCNENAECKALLEDYSNRKSNELHKVERDTKSCVSFSAKECPSRCTVNKTYNFCSPNGLTYLSCGDIKDIPPIVPNISSYAVTVLKTVVPIILIIVSIITLVKAITAGKEDEIKKAQGSLVKKLITAALIFFVITIVQFVMLKVTSDNSEHNSLSKCLSCFLNGTNKCGSIYYKDGYGKCYNVSDKKQFDCSK